MIAPRDWVLDVDPAAWVAPGAHVAGSVAIGTDSSVWFSAVLRGDNEPILLGDRSNLQDGVVVHTDPGYPVVIGDNVSVGHNAVLHGCTLGDGVLVGMGAVVMNGATIGAGSLVAAGTLVLENVQVPPGSLVLGAPGKVRRTTTAAERSNNLANAATYVALAAAHRSR